MTWPAISDYEIPATDFDRRVQAIANEAWEFRKRARAEAREQIAWERRYNILHIGDQHTPKPTPKHALQRAIRRLLGR